MVLIILAKTWICLKSNQISLWFRGMLFAVEDYTFLSVLDNNDIDKDKNIYRKKAQLPDELIG